MRPLRGLAQLGVGSGSGFGMEGLSAAARRSCALGFGGGGEELGDELPYSFGVVFLEEVAAVWEGGELGFGAGALEAGHGFGDVGEDAVFFAVDEADGRLIAGELAGDFGEAAEAEAAACFDEGFARGGALEWGGVWGSDPSSGP